MRFAPHTDDDVRDMLSAIGLDSLDGLFDQIPASVRLDRPLDIPDGVSDEDATWLAIACIVQNGVRKAEHAMGDTAVVIGLGTAACGNSRELQPASPGPGAGLRFSHPTRITNPWLPLSVRRCAEFRGVDDGRQARSVRRLLPTTHTFTIAGQRASRYSRNFG